MLRFHLITLFPEACEAYLDSSILGRARKEKRIAVHYANPRDFANNRWGKVDERPYGGGPGMVMRAMPFVQAIEKAVKRRKKPVTVWFSPSGPEFTNRDADKLRAYTDVVIVCGRYEGIDERAKKMARILGPVKTFSVGKAVYTGGEIPALAVVDAITRRIPGVLGKDESVEERRISSPEVYTRPDAIVYKKKTYRVPSILQTGDHARIDAWRAAKAKRKK